MIGFLALLANAIGAPTSDLTTALQATGPNDVAALRTLLPQAQRAGPETRAVARRALARRLAKVPDDAVAHAWLDRLGAESSHLDKAMVLAPRWPSPRRAKAADHAREKAWSTLLVALDGLPAADRAQWRGPVLAMLDRWHEAEAALDVAIERWPGPASAPRDLYLWRADVRMHRGDHDAAEKDLVAWQPQSDNDRERVGYVWYTHRQYDRAVAAWQPLALRNDPGILNNLAWVLATAPVDTVRNGPRAVELVERALKQSPDDPTFHDTHGAALAEVGRYDDAIAAVERAYAIDHPRCPIESCFPSIVDYRAQRPHRSVPGRSVTWNFRALDQNPVPPCGSPWAAAGEACE